MFVDEIRRAIEAAPRLKLPAVAALMWGAVGAGQITEQEAETLSLLIEAKKVGPAPATSRPSASRTVSRARAPASLARRRSWSASGRMPPAVAAHFTQSEIAVLTVLAIEVRRSGDCRWPIGKLAGVAGVSTSTVKRALRAARALGLIQIEERRLSAWRSDSNVVTITCRAWIAWLHRGGGGQGWPSTKTKYSGSFGSESGSAGGVPRPQKSQSACWPLRSIRSSTGGAQRFAAADYGSQTRSRHGQDEAI